MLGVKAASALRMRLSKTCYSGKITLDDMRCDILGDRQSRYAGYNLWAIDKTSELRPTRAIFENHTHHSTGYMALPVCCSRESKYQRYKVYEDLIGIGRSHFARGGYDLRGYVHMYE